jgi:hypothetical protein
MCTACLSVTEYLLATKFMPAMQAGTNLLKYAQHSANMATIKQKNVIDKQISTTNYSGVYEEAVIG